VDLSRERGKMIDEEEISKTKQKQKRKEGHACTWMK